MRALRADIELLERPGFARLGLKGPRGGEWLTAHGLVLPMSPNTWCESGSILVARLGSSEFFIEDGAGGATAASLRAAQAARPEGVYPVLREDWGCLLRGADVHDVLTQVCNVNFADMTPSAGVAVMTLMVGVSVLVIPILSDSGRAYRIWCDPTFGPYLGGTLGTVVSECGGNYKGATA